MPADGSIHLFHRKLEEVGFDRFDDRYREVRLDLGEISYYLVKEGMPRIVPADLRPGVSQVSYQIVISDLHEYEIADLPFDENPEKRS